MTSNYYRLLFKLAISFLLIGYLVFKLDWAVIVTMLTTIDFIIYMVSTVLLLALVFLNSTKFYLFLKGTPIKKSIAFLMKVNCIGRFYALFVPSGIGRGVVRWYKVTENRTNRVYFLAVSLFERLIHVFLLLILGLIPLFVYSSNEKIFVLRDSIWPIIVICLLLTLFGVGYFLFPFFQFAINRMVIWFLPARLKGENTTIFFRNFSLQNITVITFLGIFFADVLWLFVFIVRTFLLSKSMGLPLNYIDIAWMSSLVLLLQIIPISFAGIGLREGAFAYLMTVFGLAPENGASLGILFFSQMLIVALIGGLLELAEK